MYKFNQASLKSFYTSTIQLLKSCLIIFWGSCVKGLNFKGRANRKEFIIFYIVWFCLEIILIIPLYFGIPYFSGFLNLVLFIPSMAIMFRRLHDFNFSGWWYFFFNLSMGIIVIYLLIKDEAFSRNSSNISQSTLVFCYLTTIIQYIALAFIKVTPDCNRYGEPPRIITLKCSINTVTLPD